MFKRIYIAFFFCFCFLISFGQQKNYNELIVGNWQLDSVVMINVRTQKKTFSFDPGHQIIFEKFGELKVAPKPFTVAKKELPAKFSSGKWKIVHDDTLFLSTVHILSDAYLTNTGNNISKTVSNEFYDKILQLDETKLVVESKVELNANQTRFTYYTRVK